jgi:hypothetical protein
MRVIKTMKIAAVGWTLAWRLAVLTTLFLPFSTGWLRLRWAALASKALQQ